MGEEINAGDLKGFKTHEYETNIFILLEFDCCGFCLVFFPHHQRVILKRPLCSVPHPAAPDLFLFSIDAWPVVCVFIVTNCKRCLSPAAF